MSTSISDNGKVSKKVYQAICISSEKRPNLGEIFTSAFFRHCVSGIAVAHVNKIQHLASMHSSITHVSGVEKNHAESLLLFGKAIR